MGKKNYIYKRQKISAACNTETNEESFNEFCKSIAAKEINEALNNWSTTMAIQESPW